MTSHPAPKVFGRRKGKRLRARQEALVRTLLPRLRLDLNQTIRSSGAEDRPQKETWLEIGFGGGEHLACDAELNPGVDFIGCEPFVNGVAKLLATIEDNKIPNIRIHDGDALEVLEALPDACLSRITILYPDPWPKFRQRKRRIISPESINLMARVLKPNGEVRFATDIDDYSGWTLARFLANGAFEWPAREAADWTRPWPNWPGTRYEAKAIREARTPAYLTFIRKPQTTDEN